ncbi:UNVERIFIED_ORG: hypothetical protein L601_001300000210 [Gordonia westfalica J30]
MARDPYTGPPLMRSGRRHKPRHLATDFHRGWSYWFGDLWWRIRWNLEALPSGAAFMAGLFVGDHFFS